MGRARPPCWRSWRLTALAASLPASAGASVGLKRIGEFDHPVYVTGAPGYPKLLFVVEQPGRIEVVRHGHKLRRSFLDIRGLVNYDGAERGLLSIAFPPDYRGAAFLRLLHRQRRGTSASTSSSGGSPTLAAAARAAT